MKIHEVIVPVVLILSASVSFSDTIVVTTLSDELDSVSETGAGVSLREAIRDSNEDDTIIFDFELSGGVINLTERLEIGKKVIVDGLALDLPIRIRPSSEFGEENLLILAQGELSISGLVLFGGGAINRPPIVNNGALHLDGVVIENFRASDTSPIINAGSMSVRGCIFRNNVATDADWFGQTGALVNEGMLLIEDTTFENNNGEMGAGSIDNSATGNLEIRRCLFLANTSFFRSSALRNSGVALVDSSTFVGNRSYRFFGSEFSPGVLGNDGQITLNHCTIFDNGPRFPDEDPTEFGQIGILTNGNSWQSPANLEAQMTINGCLIGRNDGQQIVNWGDPDKLVITNSLIDDPNLDEPGSLDFASKSILSDLSDYGGPTRTMIPLPNEVALIGRFVDGSAGTIDQRGNIRGESSFPGAVEPQGFSDLRQLWNSDFDRDGVSLGLEIATGRDLVDFPERKNRHLSIRVGKEGKPLLSFGLSPRLLQNDLGLIHLELVRKAGLDVNPSETVIYSSLHEEESDLSAAPIRLFEDQNSSDAKNFYSLRAFLRSADE